MTKRILIIEDDDDIREVAQMALAETASWKVLAAGSGAEGVALAERELPDAILLDVMMPDLDGLAVLARLRGSQRTAAIPVILLTAKVQVARQPPSGAAGVILKPFDALTLGLQVAQMLGW